VLNPFPSEVEFSILLSLDVLEHLSKPREAVMELNRVVKDEGLVAISLPLENLTQRLLRVGFTLMRISGDPILKKAKHIPITRKPEYHYVGDIKSYDEMLKMLKKLFSFAIQQIYTYRFSQVNQRERSSHLQKEGLK